MKKTSKIIALILALIFILPLGACGDAKTEPDDTEETITYLDLFGEGSDYKLIRSDDANGAVINVFKLLKSSIIGSAGYNIPLDTDWDKKTDFSAAHEILVGQTSRSESSEAMAKLDGKGYVIAVINNKIVINATSAKHLKNAVEKFIENYVVDATKKVPSNLLDIHTETQTDNPLFKFSAVTLNGVDIKDYTIVADSLTKYDLPVYTLTDFFSKYCNKSISAVATENAKDGHKIIVGGKKADGTDYTQFETEIWYKDGNLHLGCANATMAQKTIYTFIDQYFNAAGAITIDIPADGSAQFHSTEADNWDDADPVDIISIQDRIVRSCYKCQAILELDHSVGKKFTYENHYYEYSIADARAKNNRTTNCVIVCNWVFMDANLFNHGIFNIVYDGTTGYQYEMGTDEGSAYKFCQENMQMIDMTSANMSVRGQYEEGELYPGDTLFFNGHMQTILPHMNAFDAGRMNTVGVATSSPFKRWVGDELYSSLLIGFILRANDAQPE